MMSFWRSYWRYLGTMDAVKPNSFPFHSEVIRKTPKKAGGDSWIPFNPADVPKLWKAAAEAEDGVLADLKKSSADGYLLSGLTFNKYGDRSNAIGKRFGRLKASMGYGPGHVFHSLRKTLGTMLENAGVSENLAADIVGHEKPRITYGLYSGGATLLVKAQALELVYYQGSAAPR